MSRLITLSQSKKTLIFQNKVKPDYYVSALHSKYALLNSCFARKQTPFAKRHGTVLFTSTHPLKQAAKESSKIR